MTAEDVMNAVTPSPHQGSCLCGVVTFTVTGELPPPDGCHCRECRKQSGHYFVSTDVPKSALTVHGADKITWYQSSEKVRRGFCSVCGASLFWDPIFRDFLGIALGAFDTPTRTHLKMHIFVAEKGDYYELTDGLPQHQR
jgi:hypothetical protein